MQLMADKEALKIELAKQRYRVDSHILPYVEKLRDENAELKARLKEYNSSAGVSGVSSGVQNLKLASA